MNIAFDTRGIGQDHYAQFILQLINTIQLKYTENTYHTYTIENTKIETGSIAEQTKFLKILNNGKHDIVVFCHYFRPVLYKWESICFIPSLKDVYYQDFHTSIQKHIFLFLLEKNLKKCNKLLCFEENTKEELIERFNIIPKNIFIFWGCFSNITKPKHEKIPVNLEAKFGLNDPFLIYSGGNGIEKNLEKLIKAWEKIKKNNKKISLVFLWKEVCNNVELRNLVIEKSLQDSIFFIDPIQKIEKQSLYNETLGTIFPSLYETFPFCLEEAVKYDTPILASWLSSIKQVLWESAYYFSPISVTSLYQTIEQFIEINENQRKRPKVENPNFEEKAKQLIHMITHHDPADT